MFAPEAYHASCVLPSRTYVISSPASPIYTVSPIEMFHAYGFATLPAAGFSHGYAAVAGATAKIARTARDNSAIPNFFACHLNLLNLRVKVLI